MMPATAIMAHRALVFSASTNHLSLPGFRVEGSGGRSSRKRGIWHARGQISEQRISELPACMT